MGKDAGHEMNDNIMTKGFKMLKRKGPVETSKKVMSYLTHSRNKNYMRWCKKHDTEDVFLIRQRKTVFKYMPLISIVVPLHKTEEKFINELIDSVKRQTYGNWELCMADGSGYSDKRIFQFIKKNYGNDKRIRYVHLNKNFGISENTNRALEMAVGDWIVFADHDDVLAPDALYECVKKLNEPGNEGLTMIYTDEDKISEDGKKRFCPHLKPDFSPDLIRSQNYICHMLAVSAEMAKKVHGFRKEYDGAQDYDFILRCIESIYIRFGIEKSGKYIAHIPKVLYHWRVHEGSTASGMDSKNYAHEAGKRALAAHYDRLGIHAMVESGHDGMYYRTIYGIEKNKEGKNPGVSVIIPNKDHVEDLEKCIKSIFRQDYDNYEIVIVENNSETDSVKAYYEKIEKDDRVKLLTWEGPFNFSDICNYAAEKTEGDYLLFLNNDTEMINTDCITELVGFCCRDEIGIVGARMYFPNGRLQHAGVILGLRGSAGHVFSAMEENDDIYFHRSSMAQNFCAVTGACMMIDRELFEDLEGFDSEFQIAGNDVDLCLRVLKSGKYIAYNPYARLYHYESKSRGLDLDKKSSERLEKERELLMVRHSKLIENDPYYNPNLTLEKADCTLR